MNKDLSDLVGQDYFDIRDLIKRFEELESDRDDFVIGAPDGTETPAPDQWAEENPEDAEELAEMEKFLDEVKGYGGDEQWRGDWYPVTFVDGAYFKEFAMDEAEQLDLVKSDAHWPYTCIDWDKAARELQQDYSSVDLSGVEFWYR